MAKITKMADQDQDQAIRTLVEKLGIGPYRDAKRAAGVVWYKPFVALTRLEAALVIAEMEKIKKSHTERS